MMLSNAEEERLRAYIREADLAAVEDLILAHAAPMVSMSLPQEYEREMPVPIDQFPIGSSRFGGPPDLPEGFVWPHFAVDNPLHFHSQIDLASVPAIPNSPLPQTGMLYVFVGLHDCPIFQVRLYYTDTAKQALRRTHRPMEDNYDPELRDVSDFPAEFEPFPLEGTVGIDFPYSSENGDSLFGEIRARLQPADWQSVFDRFYTLVERAEDSNYATRQASGYPLRWWHVIQLFGATNPVQARDSAVRYLEANGGSSDDLAVTRERARWRRFLSLESNSLIGFESLFDAAPYRVLVREQETPWRCFEHVDTHVESG
ncbi:MAG: DUF1963 domain-containing protein [Rhizobacter sp.]